MLKVVNAHGCCNEIKRAAPQVVDAKYVKNVKYLWVMQQDATRGAIGKGIVTICYISMGLATRRNERRHS